MGDFHETGPTRRFTNRVEDYVAYRPHYPPAAIDWIKRETGLAPGAVVADIGSGTGILARPFLERGYIVYGIEPNDAMRAAGESYLEGFEHFYSVGGTAERTGLPAARVDLVTAGQAFHWFHPAAAAREWRRILKPGAQAALVWNTRRADASAFMREYEDLLVRRAVDYRAVDHRNVDAAVLSAFFRSYKRNSLEMKQLLNYEGFEGRLMSSSYAPAPGHSGYKPLRSALRELFDRHQKNGHVEMLYETELYAGRPAEPGSKTL